MSRHTPPVPALLATLLEQYDALKDTLRRRFGDRELASDVMQDLCVSVLEGAGPGDVREPGHFLKHASKHLAIDFYRARVVRDARSMPLSACEQWPARYGCPEELVICRQTGEALLAAVGALPERCQETFILVKLYDVSQADAAAMLGISRSMVAKHLARARDALEPVVAIHSRSDHSLLP